MNKEHDTPRGTSEAPRAAPDEAREADTVVAVVPAGGRGVRMGRDVPKQFLQFGGVPLCVHALRVLEASPVIDTIIMVVPHDDVAYCQTELRPRFALSKITRVVSGGACRRDSVWNGLLAAEPRAGIVVIHDAVRPFVTDTMVRNVVESARTHGAAVVAVPVRDTVKRVTSGGMIETTIDRQSLWLAQTPQAFNLALLRDAHQRSRQRDVDATDDAVLVERLGHAVVIVNGSADNMKITRPEDLVIAEAILAAASSRRAPSSRP